MNKVDYCFGIEILYSYLLNDMYFEVFKMYKNKFNLKKYVYMILNNELFLNKNNNIIYFILNLYFWK